MSEYTIELRYPNENLSMSHHKLLEFPHVLPMDPDQLDVSFAYNVETVFLQDMVSLQIQPVYHQSGGKKRGFTFDRTTIDHIGKQQMFEIPPCIIFISLRFDKVLHMIINKRSKLRKK